MIRLYVSWVLFVFAVVNIANQIVSYVNGEPESYGLWAFIKMFLFAAALFGWEYLRR
jgi:hypothetical protein